jgi:hypothetical protein
MNTKFACHRGPDAAAQRWGCLLSGITLVLAMTLVLPQLASAQSPQRFSLPVGGHTFLTQTPDGIGIIGAFNIEEFTNQDGQVVATGIVQADLLNPAANTSTLSQALLTALSPNGVEVTMPVNILTATCRNFSMEIGPVPGLMDPIVVSAGKSSPSDERLDQSKLPTGCQMANALKKGDTDRLVSLLNDSEGVASANVASCGFIEAIKCAFAATTCGGACIAGPAACLACLASIGYVGCKDCLGI